MKIAVFSDIHDNLVRWQQAADDIKAGGIKVGICCGDLTSIETLEIVAKSFDKLYLAYGNGDWHIANSDLPLPKNVTAFKNFGAFELEGKKIAAVHNNKTAEGILESGIYDIIFYGHTHTPWEKRQGKALMLNPGEVAGHFGAPTFCVFDLGNMKGSLKRLH
jgi:uncharacterized protein